MIFTEHHGELLAVVLQDGRPFSVATHEGGCNNTYDFDWCETEGQMYYHASGAGGTPFADGGNGDKWWARADLTAVDNLQSPDEGDRLGELPAKWRDPFKDAIESETVWCDVCQEHWPEDEPCEHVWWCQECGMWSTQSPRRPHGKQS